MSAFEKPSEPATAALSDVEPSQQTADSSDTVMKPAPGIALTREIEEWR
jgi:hypothetical protein